MPTLHPRPIKSGPLGFEAQELVFFNAWFQWTARFKNMTLQTKATTSTDNQGHRDTKVGSAAESTSAQHCPCNISLVGTCFPDLQWENPYTWLLIFTQFSFLIFLVPHKWILEDWAVSDCHQGGMILTLSSKKATIPSGNHRIGKHFLNNNWNFLTIIHLFPYVFSI